MSHRMFFVIALALVAIHSLGQTTAAQSGAARGAATAAPKPANEPYVGYSLFTPLRSTDTFLINMNKEVVHVWKASNAPGSAVYLLENGDLLRGARDPDHRYFRGGGIGARMQRFDWDGNLVWDWEYANDQHCMHHDIEPLPNGNVLFIAWEKKTKEEAIAAGRDPKLLSSDQLWPDHVIEVKPEGKNGGTIVWEWHMWDHLIQDFDKTKPNYGVIFEHPELIDLNNVGSTPPASAAELAKLRSLGYTGGGDEPGAGQNRRGQADWIHSNAIDYNPELDQIVISAKNLSEIWVIDHSTTTAEAASHKGGKSGKGGDLLYRWGNPWAYKSGTSKDKQLFDQHDVRWIPKGYPGAGNIMCFNNGPGRNYTTVVEIAPPINARGRYELSDDGIFGPEKPVWEYKEDPPTKFYASHISGATRQPNGNTLICNGETGTFFEVNSTGKKLWEFTQPYGGELDQSGRKTPLTVDLSRRQGPPQDHNAVFRAIKYGVDYPAFKGKKLDPLNPQPKPFSAEVAEATAKAKAEKEAAGK